MGRPRRTIAPVIHTIKLVLTPGEDDDLIAFLEGLPVRRKASAVKTAMRSGSLGAPLDADGDDAEMLAALDEFLV